jgi:large subunit ribosomal protein L25
MEKVYLKASPRTATGRKVRALRRTGQLPGVIYGHHVESINISMDAHEASKILGKMSSSTLVTLDVDGKEYPSLVREKQMNYVKRTLIHVDFQVVSLTEKIRANVGIHLSGSSAAVKDMSALLINGLTELEVEAFPQDLPERVVVDLAPLEKIGDAIHVKDILVSDKVTVLSDPEEMVVLATAPAKEEVEEEEVVEEAEAVGEEGEPEVVEKGKTEDEEE